MIEMVSLWNISRVEINLCNALSPEQERFSTQMYNWFIVSRDFRGIEKLKHVPVHLLWATYIYLMTLQVFVALIVDNFLYPFSAVYSHFTQSINWSGVEYHLKNGKVDKV
jgi:hypothetical protein